MPPEEFAANSFSKLRYLEISESSSGGFPAPEMPPSNSV
jgi:hypothetical protein